MGTRSMLPFAMAANSVHASRAPRFISDARFPFADAHRMTLAEVRRCVPVLCLACRASRASQGRGDDHHTASSHEAPARLQRGRVTISVPNTQRTEFIAQTSEEMSEALDRVDHRFEFHKWL